MGDQMLKKAAEILKSSLREDDILARQGGDEFVVLLPQTDAAECADIIKRIKANTGLVEDLKLPLSIALGQATKVKPDENIEEIIKKADNQMYENKLSESRSSKSNIVQGLINALDAKSSETKEHALRMTKLAFDFGEKLGLTESDQNRLSLLATLHDIGKININEEILNKKDKLTAEEWELIKTHTEQGYKIASSSEEFAAVADEIFSHHEKWDGSGYPRQLKGKEIPFLARIISLVDSYDVMTNERPYSEALSKEEALAEIKRSAGSQFDPDLAAEFINLLKEK
jgi:putative nucleotidyltransferase with HDIG domain